jgi:uncharacterized membrane protein
VFELAISGFYRLIGSLNFNHPIHPLMVHVTVGTVVAAFIMGILAYTRREPYLRYAAWSCMVIAFAFTVPTVATGLMDWWHFYSGIMIFTFKMKFLLASILFVILSAGFMIGRRSSVPTAMVFIYTFCLLTVAGLGYFGGELVYGGKNKATPGLFQAGQRLYMNNCAGCHPNGGSSLASGLPVNGSPKMSSPDTFILWIRAPKRPMPAFPDAAISDREAQDLFDYITNELNKS